MKQRQKIILIICCLVGMGLSFLFHLSLNFYDKDEILATVYVNIEIDKAYSHSVSIIATKNGDNFLFPFSTDAGNTMPSIILYNEIKPNNKHTFIDALFLRMPKETAHETLNAIDGISIFIVNKLFYFSHFDVVNMSGKEQNGYILYELHGLEYKKSAIAAWLKMPKWINWYGDLNITVKIALLFLSHPGEFILTWGFFICFLILCWANFKIIYSALKRRKFLPEFLLLSLIIIAGFILRFNGYVRYSSCADEIASATTSNPSRPFLSTFEDPGNPPLYYILLRLWFIIFGWTDKSGHLFSVILGTAAIVSLFILVKRFADKKTAFLAAAYMATSTYLIGFSQEMRSYILVVFLVSIVAYRFMVILQRQELNFTNLIWYIIPSVLLANTHYYGSLFIFVNFLFFVGYSIRTKIFTRKNIIIFFSVNVIIALSLLPFFISTALQQALLSPGFNTWIGKPGYKLKCIAMSIPLLGMLYIYLRKTIFSKVLPDFCTCFLDYIVFVSSFVYHAAFGISLYRPILVMTYLIILLPLLIGFIGTVLTTAFTHSAKLIGGLCIAFAFAWIFGGDDTKHHGGNIDVYQEAQAYISHDAESHPEVSGASLPFWVDGASFYGYKNLPLYTSDDTYNVLYINPIHGSESEMHSIIVGLGIDPEKILRIRVNDSRSVYKIYL
ncbi:MAG: glycosyltransferase family 39 protein [Treponema sp.]|nr:glycosyltransferase family 39 protein [Treponema sp.]